MPEAYLRDSLRQRGIALIIVMWGLALVSILALTVATEGRSNLLVTRNLKSAAEARAMAEAGIHRALWEMLADEEERQLSASGETVTGTLGKGRYTVRILDETGRVDLNTVPPEMLEEMLVQVAPEIDVKPLVGAFLDFRDRDETPADDGSEDEDYVRLALAWDAKDRSFEHVLELEQVPGFTPALVAELLPHVTVFSRQRTLRESASLPSTQALVKGEFLNFDTAQPDVIDEPEGISGSRIYAVESMGEIGEARYAIVAYVTLSGGGGRPFQIVAWDETSPGYKPVTASDLATIAP